MDLALSLVGGGGGAAFDPSRYYGKSTPASSYNALNAASYTPLLGATRPIPSWTDIEQLNITRANSDFTFAVAGKYRWHLHMPTVPASGSFVSVRLNGSVGGVMAEHACQAVTVSAYFPALLQHQAAAGEVVTLEYAVSAGTVTYTTSPTIAGQATSAGHILIERYA